MDLIRKGNDLIIHISTSGITCVKKLKMVLLTAVPKTKSSATNVDLT